jgi:AcrR family transcriptional regulator
VSRTALLPATVSLVTDRCGWSGCWYGSLDGLSIGRLATDLGVSKSGLFGYFGSKEELQLATIRTAAGIYLDEVVGPAMAVPPGMGRVWRLCDNWLSYSHRRAGYLLAALDPRGAEALRTAFDALFGKLAPTTRARHLAAARRPG